MFRTLPFVHSLVVFACAFVIAITTPSFSSDAQAGAKRKGAQGSHSTLRKYSRISHRKRAFRSSYRKANRHHGKRYHGKRYGGKHYGAKRYGNKQRHYAKRSHRHLSPRSYIRHVSKRSTRHGLKRRHLRSRHYSARSGVRFGYHGSYKPRHLVRHYGKVSDRSRHKHYRGSYAGKRYKHHKGYGKSARYHHRKYRHAGKHRHHRYYRGRSLVISVTPPANYDSYNGFQPCPENTNCSYRLSDNGVGPAIIKLGDPGLESSPKIITFEGNVQ